MRERISLTVPRVVLLVACMVTLLGHVCVPIGTEHIGHTNPASESSDLSIASFEESCEALPSACVGCPVAVGLESPLMTPRSVPAWVRATAAPAPTEILRPPRYLLHAALLT
jgi:hypothetical protein